MKANEKRIRFDVAHHVDCIPALAAGLIKLAKNTDIVSINIDVCKEIIRLSQNILKQK